MKVKDINFEDRCKLIDELWASISNEDDEFYIKYKFNGWIREQEVDGLRNRAKQYVQELRKLPKNDIQKNK